MFFVVVGVVGVARPLNLEAFCKGPPQTETEWGSTREGELFCFTPDIVVWGRQISVTGGL